MTKMTMRTKIMTGTMTKKMMKMTKIMTGTMMTRKRRMGTMTKMTI